MADEHEFNFWHAVNNTEVLHAPVNPLETFGTTEFTYYLISELMDTAGKFRVREGRIGAARPTLITPDSMQSMLAEGFGGPEAERYAEWLANHAGNFHIMQYGFRVHKRDIKDSLLSDPQEQIVQNIKTEIARKNDPYSAIVLGVEEPWEVCLIKLLVDVVQRSAPHNANDFEQSGMLGGPGAPPPGLRQRIDEDFLAASRDDNLIPELQQALQRAGLFEEYEDRFFALVRAAENRRDRPST